MVLVENFELKLCVVYGFLCVVIMGCWVLLLLFEFMELFGKEELLCWLCGFFVFFVC